jgi:hypothetical protein
MDRSSKGTVSEVRVFGTTYAHFLTTQSSPPTAKLILFQENEQNEVKQVTLSFLPTRPDNTDLDELILKLIELKYHRDMQTVFVTHSGSHRLMQIGPLKVVFDAETHRIVT